jgi:hypothetical protein
MSVGGKRPSEGYYGEYAGSQGRKAELKTSFLDGEIFDAQRSLSVVWEITFDRYALPVPVEKPAVGEASYGAADANWSDVIMSRSSIETGRLLTCNRDRLAALKIHRPDRRAPASW